MSAPSSSRSTGTPYVELHCHSAYSFLDGASLPEELADAARELGYGAFALTDHNGVWGSMEFAQAARGLGVRALHGAEVDLLDGRHLTLLVRDGTGWRNLCRLLTAAHAHDRDPGQPPPQVGLESVLRHAEGLVCLTGCATRGVHDEATAARLLEAFGPQSLRVELQRPFARHDRARNRGLERLARRLGVPCVATGNVHAHAHRRAELQDAFVALRHHLTLESSEPVRRGNHAHVLASPFAMSTRFDDHPRAVRETALLAETLEFDLLADLGYRYPGAEDEGALRQLTELCWARIDERYSPAGADRPEAESRLAQELRVIDSLGLAGFFVLHHDLLELAREVAVEVRGPDSARALLPPGRGRGSSVSSIVCYLTGLSHIDPVANDLLLGRFLNEELTALPDIDLDFPRDLREVLIPRVHERYGHKRSALVAAFPTFRSRGAIRELGKVLGLAPAEIERVARGADDFGAEVRRDVESALGARRRSPRWEWLIRLAAEARGLPRHSSQHPGGMIVSTRPLIDCCPVVPAAMAGRQIAQWDKDSCSDAGFLKIDLLGLGMLSAVERCVEEIARTRNERIDLSRIPFDDPATYAAIQEADTVGVFQIESRAQMASLRRTRPASLDDLTVQVAIIRPGPIQGGAVNPYIERRQRLRVDPSYQIPYEHPSLAPVLADTLGTIIFQDQVLEVAQAFAGFSPGDAEGLRRAMSRRRSEAAIARYQEQFVAGARRHAGADPATARRVWEMIEGFSGFGFPKAHSAAFGLLAYQSTWLRVHYAREFLCALLNEQPMGFYPPDGLVHEGQRRGLELLAPDVNSSEPECSISPRGVRIGLGYIGGIRQAEMEDLVRERRAGGPFTSLASLAARTALSRGALEKLAWSGACDELAQDRTATSGGERRAALWELGGAAAGHPVPGGAQLALALELPAPDGLRPLDRWERLVADYATTGLTVSDHALAILRPQLPGVITSADLEHVAHGAGVTVAGLVVARQRPATAKGVVFLLLEDERGTINLIVPPPVFERYRHPARVEPLLLARGRLERPPAGGGATNVIVSELRSLSGPARGAAAATVIELGERGGTPPGAGDTEEVGQRETALRAVAPAVQSFASGRRR
ncbi:MAG TPA: DNA polymerase III subunit alpha [Solirubrobacteraceae bacterium]|jgi:error-prone DNA polymerase|nr:DNA polymerase III subunit alpha [Solirubrobacteraceae bacterium]